MPRLISDWVIIATSGATVDKRNVEKEWLQDMAKHYSEALYSAKMWPDHYRYSGSWGKVVELKLQDATEPELKGEIHLMAKLCPNDELVYLNRRGKYVHASIEVEKNFRGKGYFYLGGLGITDEPASAGTSELNFSESNKIRLPSVEVNFPEGQEQEHIQDQTLFDRIKNLLTKDTADSQDTAMNEKQFNQLNETQNKTNTLLETLIGKFTAQPPKEKEADEDKESKKEDGDDSGEKDKSEGKDEFVSKSAFDELNTKFKTLSDEFAAAKKNPVDGTKSAGDDAGAQKGVIC